MELHVDKDRVRSRFLPGPPTRYAWYKFCRDCVTWSSVHSCREIVAD